MKRALFVIAVLTILSLVALPANYARTIPANMAVPAPDGIKTVMTKVMAAGDIWTNRVSGINFGPLNKTATYGQYQSFVQAEPYYFVMDVSFTYSGGQAIHQISVSYRESAKPQGQRHGLGWKAAVTFVRMGSDGSGRETQTLLPQGKKLLKDLEGAPASVLISDLGTGWLRLYIGLATKNPSPAGPEPPDPEEAEVFSPADLGGDYTGEVSVTSS